jgi:DNA-binding NarL/FixJ family response regulator
MWQNWQDQIIITHYKEKYYKDIAVMIDRKPKDVYNRVRGLGLPVKSIQKNWDNKQRLTLLRLRLEGKKYKEIAEIMDRSPDSVEVELCRIRKKI